MMRALGAVSAMLLSVYIVFLFARFQESDAGLPVPSAPRGALTSASTSTSIPAGPSVAASAATSAQPTPPQPTLPLPTLAPPGSLKTVQWINVDDARLDESSGVCLSGRFAGSLWTHNDSGDSARVFLISPGGRVQAEVPLQDADNRDWEDIACVKGWGYCADIGDNEAKHPSVTIYRFRESAVDLTKAKGKRLLCPPVVCEKISLTYPEGPRDAETLLVRPDGVLMIVSKGLAGSTIYETPQPFKNGAKMTLRPIGEFAFPLDEGWRGLLATAGDIAPDGKRVTLLTYKRLYEWTLPRGKDAWQRVWRTQPRSYLIPELKQAEGACYTANGRGWWLTSEKDPMPLLQVAP